ncbi:hypothetical protein ACFC26_14770 [Kitasatospora purpeofusca]|uniref:hypothetical protein n=1 Tax=Kitasatospora purpeofusca TaxID=67352 RepID=UPI0035E0E547
MAASIAAIVAFAIAAIGDALRHRAVVALDLMALALAVLSLRAAAACWDRRTDAEVLHQLRLAESPCCACTLARRLGRRPGPVGLSLGRLQRARWVAPVDSVNGIVRYRAL